MLCKFCGGINPEDANYCGNCSKALRDMPLPYKRRKGRIVVKAVIILLLIFSLAVYVSYLLFETDTAESSRASEVLKKEIERLKRASSANKTIDFQFVLSPQDIDGYINEELLKKNTSFRAIHTRFYDSEIEFALSTELLYVPTKFRVRIIAETSGGDVKFYISGMSLGHLPLPKVTYKFFYGRYPYLDLEYILKLSGISFKEVRIDINKDRIFLKGVWLS